MLIENGAPTEDQEIDEKKKEKWTTKNQPQIALVFVVHSHEKKKIANDEVE